VSARLAPLPKEEWGDDEREALRVGFGDAAVDQFFADDGGRVPNVLGTLMRHPALAGPFLAYSNVLLSAPVLGARRRELLILRVAWRTRSTYEWVQHVRLALGSDVTADEIAAIGRGADAGNWSPLEAALLMAADQLLDRHRIDDETWNRLAEHLDERALVEVVFVVGTYTGLAMAFNSFGLELDPELHDVPAPPLPVGDE
jgi:4-carboxymuconolactone decarboxylase